MIKYEKILQKIGLSEKESHIYIDLLDHPFSKMIGISRRTGIHRPALYVLLPLLRERGLLFTKEKGKQVLYHATSPKVLDDLLEDMTSKLKKAIPELQSIYDAQGNHVQVQYYDGVKGIQKIYEEIPVIVPEDGEYFAYTGRDTKVSSQYFTQKFWTLRDKKRLRRYIIASGNRISDMVKKPYQEVVALPQMMNGSPFEKNMVKIIYHNRVAIIDFSLETGVVIESPIFALMEKQTFMLLFQFLSKE